MDVSEKLSHSEKVTRECPRHGDYEDLAVTVAGKQIWAGCPTCDDDQQRAERAERVAEIRERQLRFEIESRLKAACIPPRFLGRTLEDYKPGPDSNAALLAARRYADDFPAGRMVGRSLIFCGRPGTGKTHLAVGIANQIMASEFTAAFFSVINAVRRIRETYRRDSDETEREAIRTFTLPDLLILDEVGQQRGTDDEKMLLFDIINARYEAVKPTIIISNLDLAGIKEHLGERAFDRLREGGGQAVIFTWESYRR
jgi:DNA replication protein DnaC